MHTDCHIYCVLIFTVVYVICFQFIYFYIQNEILTVVFLVKTYLQMCEMSQTL